MPRNFGFSSLFLNCFLSRVLGFRVASLVTVVKKLVVAFSTDIFNFSSELPRQHFSTISTSPSGPIQAMVLLYTERHHQRIGWHRYLFPDVYKK